MFVLMMLLSLSSCFNVSDSFKNTCIQLQVPTVKFQCIHNTWAELLRKEDLSLNLIKVGSFNDTVIAVYDEYSQQYGYIIINDPTTDILVYEYSQEYGYVVISNFTTTTTTTTTMYCPLIQPYTADLPEPLLLTAKDYTVNTGSYRIIIPQDHNLYRKNELLNKIEVVETLDTFESIRVAYGIVSTDKIIKGVYLPVCSLLYRKEYIYLSTFISNYRFEIDDGDDAQICVHGDRHGGDLINEYNNKLQAANNNIIVHQKCMIPRSSIGFLVTEYNSCNATDDDDDDDDSHKVLVTNNFRFVIPQNANSTVYTNQFPLVTAVCFNDSLKYFKRSASVYGPVVYEDCRSLTDCPDGWSNCVIEDHGICNAPDIDCFSPIQLPLGYNTCVDILNDSDYTGCNNATLNIGTYFVSNTYTDLNGYDWYHICNQDWFTNLKNVRSCVSYDNLNCLNTLYRGPSCSITATPPVVVTNNATLNQLVAIDQSMVVTTNPQSVVTTTNQPVASEDSFLSSNYFIIITVVLMTFIF